MGYWIDPSSRQTAAPLWTEEEIQLALSGQPVPARSAKACEYIRLKHGVRQFSWRFAKSPYQMPPHPGPGEIPWPRWWRRAQLMRSEGYRIFEIAHILGRHKYSVRAAIYPEARAARARDNKKYQDRNAKSFHEKGLERCRRRDHFRGNCRAAAREEWRRDGGDPKALESYYRRYECL